ncbi:MAG: TIGR00730 family Rossman fold protein [Bacteroidales bacterium]|nr:TIGR00730 family Rossman fold protein [Bacteroidales bacterium]
MKDKISSLALFCGSSDSCSSSYRVLAADLGRGCAERGITLIYGGAKLGLMYSAAEAALSKNGRVVGVIPDFFSDETVVAQNITEQIWVKSMSERKQRMEAMADAFVILPGSLGTMDELFEIVTDAQLGMHRKPIVLLNAFGYYDGLLQQLDIFEREGFLRPFHRNLLSVASSVDEVFEKLSGFQYENSDCWLARYTKNSTAKG